MKLSPGLSLAVLGATVATILFATDQIVPPVSEYQAEMRIWLVGRATGAVALVLLTAVVVLGILLSHPEQARWKQAKRLYPMHELVWVFTLAFVAVHIVSLAADSYAGVGWLGAAVPGLSSYRMPAVAVGTFAAYALVLTGLSARFTKLLPSGWWLKLHRFALVGLGLGWLHGVLSGSDTLPLLGLYSGTGLVVVAAAAYRYWFVRRRVAREARMRAAGPALRPALETEMADA